MFTRKELAVLKYKDVWMNHILEQFKKEVEKCNKNLQVFKEFIKIDNF